MKNPPLHLQRKKEMTQLVGKFIKELRNVKTVEGLGSLVIKLTGFKLVDEVETKWMIKRLKSRIERLAKLEKSLDRQVVYGLVRGTVLLAILTDQVQDKVDEFGDDINRMLENIF